MKAFYWKKTYGFFIVSWIVICSITIFSGGIPIQAGTAQEEPAIPVIKGNRSYTIVDTGQNACYNGSGMEITCPASGTAFYGQDAQFTGHTPNYTLSENGAWVYDTVTGLTWKRSPETNQDGELNSEDKLTYSNAQAYCAELGAAGYEGYNDWRLPTIKELYSLINFNGTDPSGYSGTDTSVLTPFIDTTYFNFVYGDTGAGERIIDSQYASSNIYVYDSGGSSSTKLFGVNFADGRIKGYDLTMPNGTQNTFFVQCVRGNTDYGINTFVDQGNQTITDSATGLMWAQNDSGNAMNWQNALAWVQTMNSQNYLGYHDWRLPNAKELQSILDYSRSPDTSASAAIDPIFNATSFINEGDQTDWPWYWSSTTHVSHNGMGASGIYLAFGRAVGWQKATPSATCYTLYDVHGAGAQRSDPKTSNGVVIIGTACNGDTAYGLGPQGDVQRAANFIRLVRDIEREESQVYLPLLAVDDGDTTPGFDIEKTLSDGAQRNTIAFDGLAFLTGNLGADSFFPPGKVADFWGFQYLRDNDPSEMGHNTDFLTRAAFNMLFVLTPDQRAELVTLAESQVNDINQYAYNRFILMDAFRRMLEDDLPPGSTGLDSVAVQAYSAELYRLDGEISYQRAQVMGGLIHSLDAAQKAYLDAMVGHGMLEWPVVEEPEDLRGLPHDVKVAVMTYAGDLFSWYAGSLEADIYFCPERQGTYFGSIYMKDAPAVGNPGYTIPSNLTAEMGAAFLQTLTPDQASIITNLVPEQKAALYEIVDRREDVAVLLRQFMSGSTPDETVVLDLMERYGELDGEIIVRYTVAFTQVSKSLAPEQRAQLITLRTDLLAELSYPSGAYLYAQSIPMPEIPNSDFLFSID